VNAKKITPNNITHLASAVRPPREELQREERHFFGQTNQFAGIQSAACPGRAHEHVAPIEMPTAVSSGRRRTQRIKPVRHAIAVIFSVAQTGVRAQNDQSVSRTHQTTTNSAAAFGT
jgi:hypothetical protein